jgi:hypothetical protein
MCGIAPTHAIWKSKLTDLREISNERIGTSCAIGRLPSHAEWTALDRQPANDCPGRCAPLAGPRPPFESGEIGVYQLPASKRTTGTPALPLTRRHLYSTTTKKTRGYRADRSFVVMEQKDGTETLALEGSKALDRELGDVTALQA